MNPLFPFSAKVLVFAVLPSVALSATTRPANAATTTTSKAKEALPPDTHRVVRGESLWGIAMKHNTSVGEIMEINHLDVAQVKEGQLLKLKRPSPTATDVTAKKQTHTVREGETLKTIAKEYHVAESAIANANPNLSTKSLKTGSKLVIPSKAPAAKTSSARNTINHTVKDGETFYSIAKQYHANVDDVIAANPTVKPERVHEGLILKIPPKDQSASVTQEMARKPALPINTEAKVTPPKPKEPEVATKAPPPLNTASGTQAAKPSQPSLVTPRQSTVSEVRSYIVSEGETSETIAEKHRINSKRLLEYNLLPPNTTLRAGDEIMIPSSGNLTKR
jgi:LysM repeat protein